MTALQLLLYIVLALLLQVALGAAVALRRRAHAERSPAPAATHGAQLPMEPPAWQGWRDFRVTARTFEDDARTQCSFELVPVDGQPLPDFAPGQYVTIGLQVPDAQGAPRSVTRCYSLSQPPQPGHYRITVKRVADGTASNHLHEHVQAGSVVQLKAPAGAFRIDDEAAVPAVFVAGGIGITPILCMLDWCLQAQPTRAVRLYYGVRDGHAQAFTAALRGLAARHPRFTLHEVYSQPGADDITDAGHTHRGHVDIDLLRRTLPAGRHRFFVCGPPALMQSLVPALRDWGVPPDDLLFEAFGPASIGTPAPAATAAANESFAVRWAASARTLQWTSADGTLLDFAERNGIAVDSGCRRGACGTCATRVLDGSVRYAHTPDSEPPAGHCLLCIAHPASALTLEA